MSLAHSIRVNTSYTRSINIERDSEAQDNLRPYILTSRAMQVLGRIADTLDPGEAPRAWALIGPYGSGKSAFGLFLGQLLGQGGSGAHRYARTVLEQGAPNLAEAYGRRLADTQGFCVVALSGSPEALGARLLRALHGAAKGYFAGLPGRAPRVLSRLAEAAAEGAGIGLIVERVAELQAAIHAAGGAGLLIVIDELGKFLEYEARHRGATEIHLLQALAEHAFRAEAAPLQLVVLLHQSFEQYAQTLGEQLRNEWKKVQGRFESVPFLETTEQTIRVVKAALIPRFDETARRRIEADARRLAEALDELHALPSALDTEEAAALFAGCYPLHPVALLLLPTLCQRVAQNERTLFSYLGSREPHGFLDSLERLSADAETPAWIEPADIYEYFILNQPGLVTDHLTHRRWAEVVTALERLGDAPAAEERLVKTIGLMNIVGAQGGLKPSPELLPLCAGPAAEDALAELARKSIVTHRRYNNEYRVWQGSDFDLDSALAEQLDQIGRADLADLLNDTRPLPPIVARRHAIQTGTLRYFVPEFVSGRNLGRIRPTEQPTLFVCLADALDEADAMRKALLELGEAHACGVVVGNPQALSEAVLTVHALLRLQRDNPLLPGDPVAQREVKDRLAAARRTEAALLSDIFENPQASDWVFLGKYLAGFTTRRDLQARFSAVLDKVYHAAPILRNELINRDKPSASAMSGRNKLLAAMFERGGEEDLGIAKYPAEKAMYRALLRATGLHYRGPKGWTFGFAPPPKDPYHITPIWKAIGKKLNNTETKPINLGDLFGTLALPPFGLKAGVIPILFLAFYLADQDELALFEEDNFIPFFTMEVLERLIKAPSTFRLQKFRIDTLRQTLFRRYAEVLSGSTPEDANLLTAAKPLARLMMSLPDYTKRTNRLSPEAVKVRDLFFAAKSPAELMLVDLPSACGFSSLISTDTGADILESYTARFQAIVRELKSAYHVLLADFQNMLKRAFGIDKKLLPHELRAKLRGLCMGLEDYTIDTHGLKAFLGRIVDTYGDENAWLVSVASFLARKPPEKWGDDDISAVEYRLGEYSRRIRDLERLNFEHRERVADSDDEIELVLLKSIIKHRGEQQRFVTLTPSKKARIQARVQNALGEIFALEDEDLRLAALAMIYTEASSSDKLPSVDNNQTESGESVWTKKPFAMS